MAPLADNYNITTSSGTLTITKKDLVVGGAAHDFTTVYGATPGVAASVDLSAEAGNAANATGWENDDQNKVTLTRVHGVTSASSVGTYDVNLVLGKNLPIWVF